MAAGNHLVPLGNLRTIVHRTHQAIGCKHQLTEAELPPMIEPVTLLPTLPREHGVTPLAAAMSSPRCGS